MREGGGLSVSKLDLVEDGGVNRAFPYLFGAGAVLGVVGLALLSPTSPPCPEDSTILVVDSRGHSMIRGDVRLASHEVFDGVVSGRDYGVGFLLAGAAPPALQEATCERYKVGSQMRVFEVTPTKKGFDFMSLVAFIRIDGDQGRLVGLGFLRHTDELENLGFCVPDQLEIVLDCAGGDLAIDISADFEALRERSSDAAFRVVWAFRGHESVFADIPDHRASLLDAVDAILAND